MGNWRNRPPRRFFYQQGRAPLSFPVPSYDHEPPPCSGFSEDGVPLWEKKFCYSIGSVPWRKVVDVKKFMYCHSNIVNWDDSAGEEAFQNAKRRFWSDINGLPCDITLPDPDIYIDKINWNPDIDSELIKDLEKSFFAPDEGEKESKARRRNKKTRNSIYVPSGGNLGTVDSPWERHNKAGTSGALEDKAQSWVIWNNNITNSENLNNNDPWERNLTQGNEATKGNLWGDCDDKAWSWNKGGNDVNQLKDWNNGTNHWDQHSLKDRGWGILTNKSWGWNQHEHNGNNPWGHSCIRDSRALMDRGWRDSTGNAWGWKQWDNHNKQPTSLEFRACTGWGTWNGGFQNRGGSQQYIMGYKGSTFQGDDYQTGHHWRREKTKKRVSFA